KPGDGDLRVISENDSVTLTLNEKRDAASVTISETARPGVHWLRFCNADGATELKPFIVGMIPEIGESEPNAKTTEANAVSSPSVTVNGVLQKSGDVDTFVVTLNKDQTLVAAMEANVVLGSPMDGVLQIVNARGTIVAQNDDDISLDPRVTFTATEDGTLFVRTFAFPAAPNSTIGFAGGADYVYRLTLSTAPVIEHTEPVAIFTGDSDTSLTVFGWNISSPETSIPIDQRTLSEPYALAFPVPTCNIPSISESKLAEDRRLPIPIAVTGRIVSSGASTFPFAATKGQKLSISVQARQFGSLLDPVLAVEDNAGKIIKESDDINGGNQDSEIHLTIPADGQYLARISDRFQDFGDRYFYVLRCEETLSSFKATLTSTAGSLKADKPLEIPIAFDRRHGFAEPIDVKIEGLPDGVTFECPRSEKDGDTSKTVTLKISGSTAEPFQGPVRIIAESAESKRSLAVVFTTADQAETGDYWLTVPK
ncbi:MAG: hypothetical protein O2856_14875, partial [Planctomycetota bacterium]|nr:hypothetical protein [Planctomycetota bacterium]